MILPQNEKIVPLKSLEFWHDQDNFYFTLRTCFQIQFYHFQKNHIFLIFVLNIISWRALNIKIVLLNSIIQIRKFNNLRIHISYPKWYLIFVLIIRNYGAEQFKDISYSYINFIIFYFWFRYLRINMYEFCIFAICCISISITFINAISCMFHWYYYHLFEVIKCLSFYLY